MARTTYGISTSAITWEKTESEISVSETGMAEITVEGAVNSTGIGLLDALKLIPNTLPVGNNGPIGSAPEFAGAAIKTKSAFYKEGTWQVRATYQKANAQTTNEGGQDISDNDRYERRIVVNEEPILTHPVAMRFERKELNKLANLLNGNIEANSDPDYNGDDAQEFVLANQAEGSSPIYIEFGTEAQTVDGVTASPLDFARMIKAGITSYNRKTIRHTWSTTRENPAPTDQYRAVGTVVSTPRGAPSLGDGYQWMLTGIIDASQNDETWNTVYEFDASGAGGYLAALYKGGEATLDA